VGAVRYIAAFIHWLGHPFRAIGDALRALVNLSRIQMRAVFSLAMLGGIISLSFQNMALIVLVDQRGEIEIASLLGKMILSQQFWNNAIMGAFALILGLVVWGADRFRMKSRIAEIEAGRGPDVTEGEE
jgi:hypothetical protein